MATRVNFALGMLIASAPITKMYTPRLNRRVALHTRGQLLNKFDRNGRAEGASFGHKDEELATNLCSVVSIAIKSATSEAHAHGAVELAAKTTHAGDDTGYATTHR